jgi:hypothetical protein
MLGVVQFDYVQGLLDAPYPETLDPIASIYFVHRPLKKEEDEDEEGQGRNHDAEAHSEDDHRVEWGSVGN